MDYIITMQYLENYGIHNDKPSHYWKAKGGEMYYIHGAPEREATVVACLNLVKAETNTVGGQFYIKSVEAYRPWMKSKYGFSYTEADKAAEMEELKEQGAIPLAWRDLQKEADGVLEKRYGLEVSA